MASDAYLVSARKHRPQSFTDLVSQSHVTETLQNAIQRNRVGQAYLFSGPRGVGKTTVARLLAKAINCQTELADRKEAEPCGTCESCITISEGRSLNIIEIDAASNNGVEDARELRNTVRIPPQGALKKVYIIDEVHMMSNAAFNTLLKTLEEPPDYAHFIFATTEPKKVLPTILSRCQRFNFRRISVTETYERLVHICKLEGIKADEASLMLIARKGDGALRDALSAFDQAISLCGTNISYEALSTALGLIDSDQYFDVTDLILQSDRPGLIRFLDRVISEGFDLEEFLSGLSEHLRNLYLARSMSATDLIDADTETKARYAKSAEPFSEVDLMRLLMIASDTQDGLRRAIHPRLKLELGMLKMASISSTSEIGELLELVRKNKGVMPQAATTPSKKSGPSSSVEVHAKTETKSADAPTARMPEAKVSIKERVDTKPVQHQSLLMGSSAAIKLDLSEAETPPPMTAVSDPLEIVSESKVETIPASESKEVVEKATVPAPSTNMSKLISEDSVPKRPTLFGSPAFSSAPPKPPEKELKNETETAVIRDLSPALVFLNGIWDKFCARIIGDRIQVGALLKHATVENFGEGKIWLKVPDKLHSDLLASESVYILKMLNEETQKFRFDALVFICSERSEPGAIMESSQEQLQNENLEKVKTDNPVVRDLLDRFDATIVW